MNSAWFNERATILAVDDTPDNLALVNAVLRGAYKVKVANTGARALRIAAAEVPPDLILLDVAMPEMDGYEVCRRLKADPRTRDIPVIFLTARDQVCEEERGFSLGAVDYITKPISAPILAARVRNHLALKATADFLRDHNGYLEREVAQRTAQMTAVQDVMIFALASLAETRDSETGNHIARTQFYVKALAQRLRRHARFEAALSDAFIDLLFKSAPLHDIGKVGIPDRILLKPGRLDPLEFEVMKTHAALGRDAIEQAERKLGLRVEFLDMAKAIALHHHEKWDGSGYPQGLAGEAIPLAARLMAVADVYDALISRRVYKAPMSHAAAVGIIAAGRGTHFDPDVADAFAAIQDEFLLIAQRYTDSDADLDRKREYLEIAGLGSA